jgi:hypothetical protein
VLKVTEKFGEPFVVGDSVVRIERKGEGESFHLLVDSEETVLRAKLVAKLLVDAGYIRIGDCWFKNNERVELYDACKAVGLIK